MMEVVFFWVLGGSGAQRRVLLPLLLLLALPPRQCRLLRGAPLVSCRRVVVECSFCGKGERWRGSCFVFFLNRILTLTSPCRNQTIIDE